jgi:LemA protein
VILPQVIIPVIFVLIASVAWFINNYNRFIKYRNKIEEAWNGIDVVLKRRFNLIPNLIHAIEGYGEHEAKIISPWIWQPSGNYRRWVFHN